MDPEVVSEKVVTQRLTQVAAQLSKVTSAPDKSDDSKLEDELLKEDTPMVTPSLSPEDPGTPAEPADANAPDAKVDQLDQRVSQIFGKKRAIEGDGNTACPKVANITVTDASDGGAAVTAPPVHNNVINITVAKPVDVETSNDQAKANNSVDNATNKVADNNGETNMDVGDGNQEEEDNGEWQEAEEEPEAWPEGAFPMQVPGYPMQPTFNYRYRTPNSTPRSRRIDFKNAIVMRNCSRDPHTNRVSQEDYEAREDSEMSLSLGYVVFVFVTPFTIKFRRKKILFLRVVNYI